MATNLPRQREIFRLLALPLFSARVQTDPGFPFKFLSTRYLCRGLPTRARAASLVHHFQFLEAHLPGSLLHQRQPLAMTVFKKREGDSLYTVQLDFPAEDSIYEGESRLGMLVDGVLVYCLQFSIVPGWVVQSTERDVVFVLRLQGVKGLYEQIRTATRALEDVAPPALLMAALQGIASAWGVREMAGICARSQYCYRESAASLYTQTYDDFFAAIGATRVTSDFFRGPLPLPVKALDRIKNGHKSRTQKKRAFKLQIAEEVSRWMSRDTAATLATVPKRDLEAPIEERPFAS
jgi:uncharacterized protein VirK/YbjX